MNVEKSCGNCELWKMRKDQGFAKKTLDIAAENLKSEDPMTQSMAGVLIAGSISGIGDRKCSVGGSGFGIMDCFKPLEFKPRINVSKTI